MPLALCPNCGEDLTGQEGYGGEGDGFGGEGDGYGFGGHGLGHGRSHGHGRGQEGMMGVGRRRRVMPLGAARQYTMEPHAYYDASAEITTEGTKIKFMRSKIRCTSFAEWMEISDPETGKAVWRVEARFADRNFYAPEITGEGKQERKYSFVTAIRLYRGYEKDPAVMLVHRDQQPGGMGEPHSNKSVEVYMCRAIGDKAAADLDPDAELDEFLRDGTSGRPLMPKLQEPPASWAPTPDTDESFFFMNAKQGEDQFLMISNATLTSISLSALTEFSGDSSVPIVERRVLANLKRNDVTSPRKLEIDSGAPAHPPVSSSWCFSPWPLKLLTHPPLLHFRAPIAITSPPPHCVLRRSPG